MAEPDDVHANKVLFPIDFIRHFLKSKYDTLKIFTSILEWMYYKANMHRIYSFLKIIDYIGEK